MRSKILRAPLVIAMRKPTLKLTAQNLVVEMFHTSGPGRSVSEPIIQPKRWTLISDQFPIFVIVTSSTYILDVRWIAFAPSQCRYILAKCSNGQGCDSHSDRMFLRCFVQLAKTKNGEMFSLHNICHKSLWHKYEQNHRVNKNMHIASLLQPAASVCLRSVGCANRKCRATARDKDNGNCNDIKLQLNINNFGLRRRTHAVRERRTIENF